VRQELGEDKEEGWTKKGTHNVSLCRQVSISSTFYAQIFHMKVVLAAFSSYVLALAKNSYKKHVRSMLMKLTSGSGQ